MTTMSQSTKRKLSLLQLAEELGNVSKACKIMGYHRDTFYEVRKAFKVGGVAALVEQRRGPKHPHPSRVPEAVEHRTTKDRSPRTNENGPRLGPIAFVTTREVRRRSVPASPAAEPVGPIPLAVVIGVEAQVRGGQQYEHTDQHHQRRPAQRGYGHCDRRGCLRPGQQRCAQQRTTCNHSVGNHP